MSKTEAGIVEAFARLLPHEIRHWDKKAEFYGVGKDPATYDDREKTAIEELRRAGDTTSIVINEGDWLMLMWAWQSLRSLAVLDAEESGASAASPAPKPPSPSSPPHVR